MATEAESGLSDHARGVVVTTVACLMGVAAAIVSGIIVGTDPSGAQSTQSLFVLAGALLLEYPLLRVLGIDVNDFGAKDHLYVAFMTFTLWFIAYTILLTSNTTF